MKALIAGLGSIGRRHGRNLRTLSVDVVGFDPDVARREAFASEVAGSVVCATLEEGLAAGCDFGVIASPNAFHVEQALACARRGLHLFIEKPLGVDARGVPELLADVDARQLVALLGSNWKFHPSLIRLKEIVDRAEIGTVLAVQAVGGQYLPDWHPWEDYRQMYSSKRDLGGGVLFDSHDLDYLTWLLGPLESIGCRLVSTGTLDIETSDLACFILMFASGAIGTLQLDYLQRPYARRIHLTGSEGTAIWDYGEGMVRAYLASARAWREFRVPDGYDLNEMYVDEMRHFLRCIEERRQTVTPLSQAMHVLAVFDRACASSRSGGAVMAVA